MSSSWRTRRCETSSSTCRHLREWQLLDCVSRIRTVRAGIRTSRPGLVFFSSLLTETLQGKWCEDGALYSFTVTAKHKLPAFLTDRVFLLLFCCCCIRVKALFPLLVKTQTTTLVQYMSTFIMRQIKCHSIERLHFARSPWEETEWDLATRLKLPFIHSQFLLSFRASYFLLSISSSATRLGPWGTTKMLSSRRFIHPGRKWKGNREGQEMFRELTLFLHTSCPKELHHGDLCQEISDT